MLKKIDEKTVTKFVSTINDNMFIYVTDEEYFLLETYTWIEFANAFNTYQFISDNPDRFKIYFSKKEAKEYIQKKELEAEQLGVKTLC